MDKQTKEEDLILQEPDNSHIGWEHPKGFLPEVEKEDPSTEQEPS